MAMTHSLMFPITLLGLLSLSQAAPNSTPTTLETQTAQLRALVAESPKLNLVRTALAVQPPAAGWALDMVSSVAVDAAGIICVLQRFDLEGHYLGEWSGFGKTFSLTIGSGFLWIGTQPRNETNGAPGWLMKIDPATGKLLGSVESPGHHSIDVTARGDLFTGTRPNQVLWFRERVP